MPNYNRLQIIGHLGRDPEQRTTSGGKTVTNFSVAVTEKSGGKEETTWVRVTAWDKTGDLCAQYLTKGRAVMVEGPVRLNKYEGKNGPDASLEMTARQVTFLGGGKDSGGGGGRKSAPPAGGDDLMPGGHSDPGGGEDDIPFARPASRAVTDVGGQGWRRAPWRTF